MYAADTDEQSVIRITPSGTVAEYPTYSSFGHSYFAPLEIAVDSSNKLYVADEAWQATGSNVTAGLTVVAPTLW